MSNHTQGPWQVQKPNWVGTDPNGYFTTARCSGATNEEAIANAERVVVCVNAMDGVADPARFRALAEEMYHALCQVETAQPGLFKSVRAAITLAEQK